ncbi:MAG: efflux RND transporter periplasmic adaptor subunit [Cyanobacteria bacterium J06592_8]
MAYHKVVSEFDDQYLPSQTEPFSVKAEDLQDSKLVHDDSDLEEEEEDDIPSEPRSGGWGSMVSGIGLGVLGTLAVIHFYVNPRTQTTEPSQQEAPVEVVAPSTVSTQTVTVAPVELATVTRKLDVTGTVEAYDLLPVLPQANGLQIQQVLVDEGDFVEAGELLAVLDNSILRSQIAQAIASVESERSAVRQRQADRVRAEAALAQAEANLAETRSALVQNEARLGEAIANLEQAEREVERYQSLNDEGAISLQELETRITSAKTAKESVRVAEANISSAEARIKSSQASVFSARADIDSATATIRTAEANVRNRQASVDQLQTQLQQTEVRAPANGVIAERIARIGDVTNGTEELFKIIAENQLELHAKVPETQLAQIQLGVPVAITSDADPNLRVQGIVREIAPLIDPQSRKATVKIDLPPLGAIPDSFLRPGMFLRAAISTSSTQGLKIPAKAVVPQADGSAIVYRITNNDTVQATRVEVGEIRGNFGGDLTQAKVEIQSGLNLGDRIVVSGAAYLKDGDAVNVAPN